MELKGIYDMSKNGRKSISFSEADHARIVEAAKALGYNVGAGKTSQIGRFMLDMVFESGIINIDRIAENGQKWDGNGDQRP